MDWTILTDARIRIFLDSAAVELPKIVTSFAVLGLGWLIGKRLSLLWSERQKRREQDLIAARDFHRAYGEFFATWKLWNYFHGQGVGSFPGASRWDILDRACKAEATLESTFVRLASERDLTPIDLDILGRFRQIFQQLREAIRDSRPLDWRHSEHPDYAEFKRLAPQVAAIISSQRLVDGQLLAKITSNGFEPK